MNSVSDYCQHGQGLAEQIARQTRGASRPPWDAQDCQSRQPPSTDSHGNLSKVVPLHLAHVPLGTLCWPELDAHELECTCCSGSRDIEKGLLEEDEHNHYSQRAPWLRAGVLGANDGLVSSLSYGRTYAKAGRLSTVLLLYNASRFSSSAALCRGSATWLQVSVASLMMGVEGGSSVLHSVVLAGLAGLVGGALSMVSCACCRGATDDMKSWSGFCNVMLVC